MAAAVEEKKVSKTPRLDAFTKIYTNIDADIKQYEANLEDIFTGKKEQTEVEFWSDFDVFCEGICDQIDKIHDVIHSDLNNGELAIIQYSSAVESISRAADFLKKVPSFTPGKNPIGDHQIRSFMSIITVVRTALHKRIVQGIDETIAYENPL